MQRTGGWISINGRLLDPQDATVSVLDSGFLLGDGFFESMRATDGQPYLLKRHLQRLFDAAAQCEFTNMPSIEMVTERVHTTLERAALQEAYVRVTITRGTGAIGLTPPSGPPTVVVAALPVGPPPQAEDTLAVTLLPPTSHRALPAKSTSWQHAVIARRAVERAGADEGIYLSESGHILEAVASNVFVVSDEQLLTPPVHECLPGITRARVIELARQHGIPVSEAAVHTQTLGQADEMFLTNSVQGLRAVETIDGATIENSSATNIFATLHALYEQDRLGVVPEMT